MRELRAANVRAHQWPTFRAHERKTYSYLEDRHVHSSDLFGVLCAVSGRGFDALGSLDLLARLHGANEYARGSHAVNEFLRDLDPDSAHQRAKPMAQALGDQLRSTDTKVLQRTLVRAQGMARPRGAPHLEDHDLALDQKRQVLNELLRLLGRVACAGVAGWNRIAVTWTRCKSARRHERRPNATHAVSVARRYCAAVLQRRDPLAPTAS